LCTSGEKENCISVNRSLESRVSDLQQEQAGHSALVRDLQHQMAMSVVEVKRSQKDTETTDMKHSGIVGRLVAKSKEVLALTGEKTLLVAENEFLTRQLRHEAQKQKSGGVSKSKSSSDDDSELESLKSERDLLRELNITYCKEVAVLQRQVDAATSECEEARDSAQRVDRLMSANKERFDFVNESLENMSKKLNESIFNAAKLEGKVKRLTVLLSSSSSSSRDLFYIISGLLLFVCNKT
jgi:chromosome segregation ATPase